MVSLRFASKHFCSVMVFQTLPRRNGQSHLPIPRGKHIVGATDLETENGLLLRCYYPVAISESSSDHFKSFSSWLPWLPSLEYADGYLRFKFSASIPLLPRVFRFLLCDPKCPTDGNAPVLIGDKPMPVIIFSHGLGAMRTTYSILLTELASQGNFVAAVEHKDGSASATRDGQGVWQFERKILPGENEYTVRNAQVTQRVEECESVYRLLCHLGGKSAVKEDLKLRKSPAAEKFVDAIAKAKLDLDKGCYISGHSFGGATALKALCTSRYVALHFSVIIFSSCPCEAETADVNYLELEVCVNVSR